MKGDWKGQKWWEEGGRLQTAPHIVCNYKFSIIPEFIFHCQICLPWGPSAIEHRSYVNTRTLLQSYWFSFFFSLVLAVQNMEASGTVAKEQEIEFSALKGSLSMMSKGKFILSYKIIIYWS